MPQGCRGGAVLTKHNSKLGAPKIPHYFATEGAVIGKLLPSVLVGVVKEAFQGVVWRLPVMSSLGGGSSDKGHRPGGSPVALPEVQCNRSLSSWKNGMLSQAQTARVVPSELWQRNIRESLPPALAVVTYLSAHMSFCSDCSGSFSEAFLPAHTLKAYIDLHLSGFVKIWKVERVKIREAVSVFHLELGHLNPHKVPHGMQGRTPK